MVRASLDSKFERATARSSHHGVGETGYSISTISMFMSHVTAPFPTQCAGEGEGMGGQVDGNTHLGIEFDPVTTRCHGSHKGGLTQHLIG